MNVQRYAKVAGVLLLISVVAGGFGEAYAPSKLIVAGDVAATVANLKSFEFIYRLGFAASRSQARQLVRHGHFEVNGRRVNIPSYQVSPDDAVSIRDGSAAKAVVTDATDLTASVAPWLQADHDNLTGKVLRVPDRVDIDTPVQEQLIVELYSK